MATAAAVVLIPYVIPKRCPQEACDRFLGALAGSAQVRNRLIRTSSPAQAAFSTTSRPWNKQLELMDTSSFGDCASR